MKEHTITITEGERRKLLIWAKNDYNKLFRIGNVPAVKSIENRQKLVDKLKAVRHHKGDDL